MAVPSELCDKFRLALAERFEPHGWKYLKSKHVLKKRVGDIVFEVYLGSSWNNSAESARVRMWLMSYCKSISKKNCPESSVMGFRFAPTKGDSSEWWELTTPNEYEFAVRDASNLFEQAMFPLIEKFENDYEAAVYDVAMNGYTSPCLYTSSPRNHTAFCHIPFASHVLGKKLGKQAAIRQYEVKSDNEKLFVRNQLQRYIENMEKAKVWRSNGSYLASPEVMFMVDNGMIKLSDDGAISFEPVE